MTTRPAGISQAGRRWREILHCLNENRDDVVSEIARPKDEPKRRRGGKLPMFGSGNSRLALPPIIARSQKPLTMRCRRRPISLFDPRTSRHGR